MKKTKIIYLLITFIIFLLIYLIFFYKVEKREWIKLNDKILLFDNELRFKSFEEIYNNRTIIDKQILEFKKKFPNWRKNDLNFIQNKLQTIANEKILIYAQTRIELISTSLDTNELKIKLLDKVLDTLILFQPSFTIDNIDHITKIKENINEEIYLIRFDISWNKKINEIDEEIKKYIEEKWILSDTVKKYNTSLREFKINMPKISDIEIISKICDVEIDSKKEKRYYYRFQAIAKGETKVNPLSKFFNVGQDKYWSINAEGRVGITGRYKYDPYFLSETFQAIQIKIINF
jgi:hypothetical protein